jgi:hypothetical protein
MNPDSPFATPSDIPIIGQPKIVGAVVSILMLCNCEAHSPILGVAGGTFTCPACKLQWQIQAEMKFMIQQVVAASKLTP